jgi:hypothetical protein
MTLSLISSYSCPVFNKKQDDTGLLHTRYRALHYLKPELKQKYIRAEFIAERLVAIMTFNACNKSCFKILCSDGNNTGVG